MDEDRVVISNPGGIAKGIDIKSLIGGVSIRRNELIADIFARMNKAERIGSVLQRIGEIMEAADQTYPEIESNLFFKITFKRPFYTESSEKGSEKSSEKGSEKITDEERKKIAENTAPILEEIKKDPYISAKKLSEIMRISSRAIEKHISNLKAVGILERIGPDRGGYWKINEFD